MSGEGYIATNVISWWIVWLALEYFWLSGEAVSIMTALLALDFILWVSQVYVQDKSKLSSSLAWKWLFKKMSRWMIPFVVIIVIRWAWIEDVDYLSSVVCWIIIISEWYSVLWHIYSINYWRELPEIDCLEALIQWLSGFFKWTMENKANVALKENKKEETKKKE